MTTEPTQAISQRNDASIPTIRPADLRQLISALHTLREEITSTRYPLTLPSGQSAADTRQTMARDLDDYLIARLSRLDAPLLVVIGGPTGAGKSTLINSLIRTPVSPAGVLRPTTRTPVLVCHPTDTSWFTGKNSLSWLTKETDSGGNDLRVVSAPLLTPGAALLDAPDIDSIRHDNHTLATRLFSASDMWLFVTTASRYADAVPWNLLRAARDKGTATALVLNRIPQNAGYEITKHLSSMIMENDLSDMPLFVVPESPKDGQGLLSEELMAPLLAWLTKIARSSSTRIAVSRQTLGGAIDALDLAVEGLATAMEDQMAAAKFLESVVNTTYDSAKSLVEQGVRDGALLRGEALAQWQKLVGSGDVLLLSPRYTKGLFGRIRQLRATTASLMNRVDPLARIQETLEENIVAVLHSVITDAAEQTHATWSSHTAGAQLLTYNGTDLSKPQPQITELIHQIIGDWKNSIPDFIHQAENKSGTTKKLTNTHMSHLSLLIMVAACSATSYATDGTETIVPRGAVSAAQSILEDVFNERESNIIIGQTRKNLIMKINGLLSQEAHRYSDIIAAEKIDDTASSRLRVAAGEVTVARLCAGLPAARTITSALPPVGCGTDVTSCHPLVANLDLQQIPVVHSQVNSDVPQLLPTAASHQAHQNQKSDTSNPPRIQTPESGESS